MKPASRDIPEAKPELGVQVVEVYPGTARFGATPAGRAVQRLDAELGQPPVGDVLQVGAHVGEGEAGRFRAPHVVPACRAYTRRATRRIWLKGAVI